MSRDHNLLPMSGNWQTRREYGNYTPSYNEYWRPSMFPSSIPPQASWDVIGNLQQPERIYEERVITGPIRMTQLHSHYPANPPPPVRFIIFENQVSRGMIPRQRQLIQGPSSEYAGQLDMQTPTTLDDSRLTQVSRGMIPRQRQLIQGPSSEYAGQLDMQTPTTLDDSRLTQFQQKTALERLKREKYNPVPKNISRRLCLYYRDYAINNYKEKTMPNEEEGKRCAVCLDDFEPKEDVMLTPCNHMFHEDCIVPWVKSHGQCPVCRSAIYEQTKQTMSAVDNNSMDNTVMYLQEILYR